MSFVAYKAEADLKRVGHGGNLARVRKALATIVNNTCNACLFDTVILFGYPGAGKTSLIESALSDAINYTGKNMDMVRINCNTLIADHPDASSALVELHKMRGKYLKNLPHLRVFVFDEIDAIGPERDRPGGSAMQALCHFCMDSLNLSISQVIWLLITNYPRILDSAIRSRACKRLHLPCPDREAAKVIIEEWLDPSHAALLLDKLLIPSRDYELNVRSLVEGLKFLNDRGKILGRQISSCNIDEAVNYILGGGGFPQKVELNEYNEKYKEFLQQSELLMRAYGL
jgi:chromosomal replication initiation ATPase DnaA